MLRWSTLGLLAIMTLPSWAAKRVSVAQLEQTLSAMAGAHRTDAETAIRIGTLELTERISDATLDRLTKQYARGAQTSVTLQLLADRSSFLELPPGELGPNPAPDAATQQKLLDMGRRFALETLPRLPNLIATRTTYSFDDGPRQVKKDWWPVKAGLHLVDIAKTEVNVRNELESIAAGTLPGSRRPNGLTTWGAFGSALLMVQNDSTKGTTTWSHWEQFPAGPVAVFNYSVPQSASHYEIAVPAEKITHIDVADRDLEGAFNPTAGYILSGTGNNGMAHARPGYHGSLWIDPASGTILRITFIAEIQGNSNLDRAATRVEYGPVEIGGKSFVGPIRSFVFSDAPTNPTTDLNGGITERLNENLFTNYHQFAATSRIVGEAAAGAGPTTASEEANGEPGAAAGPPPEAPGTSAVPTIETSETASATSPPQPAPAAQPPAVASPQTIPAVPPEQPSGVTPAPQPPSIGPSIEPAGHSAPNSSPATMPPHPGVPPETPEPDTGLTLHVNVNVVLVPVVVRDEHEQTIDDLQKQDFAVFDDGSRVPSPDSRSRRRPCLGKPSKSPQHPKVRRRRMAAPQTMALPDRITVFVFDDLHLTNEQISYAQKAAIQTLGDALTDSDLAAIVTTSGNINSGLTTDRTLLIGAIGAVRPSLIYRSDTLECPVLTYYQADLIANQHDPTAMADATQRFRTTCSPELHSRIQMSGSATPSLQTGDDSEPIILAAARQELEMGRQDLLNTYATIGEIVKKMSRLPGEHAMVLISPGFPPVDAEEREAESRLINLAAQSGVTINALNASGLYTTSIEASDDTKEIRNPVLTAQYREREMQNEENAIWELADGTGGKFFHNNNDLAAGFRVLLAPETVYLLELPLDGIKPNGAWHRLSVKTDRPGAHLRARQGYFAPAKTAKRKRDADARF